MTFNTGNNVPSTDPRDLYDNAENLDKLVNGVDPFYADRKGVLRQSWAGMENDFDTSQAGRENAFTLSQADKESRFQAFLVSSGYVSKGNYAAGVVLEERNEYVAVDAATTGTTAGLYRPGPGATLPLTLTGTWATDKANLVLLGDDVLRQELANGTPFLVDNAIVGRSLRLVNSFAELRTVAPRHSNDQVLLLSHTVDGFGGGQFRWDASSLAADDNGTVATVIGQSGAWVRVLTRDGVRPEWWGAVPDSGQDDSAPLQTAINFAASVSGTQLGARVVLSAGQYSYTKSLVVQHESGFCPEIVGQGAFKTALHKTTTALPDGSGSHVVDAYLTFINRGASLYNYKANLRGFRCTSPDGVRHKYGIFAEKISSSQFEDIDIYSVEDGYYTTDAWMMNYKAVRIHDCYRGFVWNGGGTSNLLQNCWVEYARDTAYDIYGLTYSTFIGCGADHVYDSADLTANKIAYKQSITWCLTFIGCGAEDVRGSIFYGSNAVFRVEGFRMYGIKYSSATQKLLELLGSKCSFDSCHFAHYDGSVTAANKLAITAVSQNSTNNVSFANCRWELTNLGVPGDAYGNERALASNLPLDVEGLRTARLAMSDATWRPLCKLKANCRIQFLAIVADGADRYVAPTGLYGPSVSTNPESPTTLGNILNGAGTVIMAMQAYIGADNTLYLKNAATGEGRTFCFTFVTPQHW